jgi:hypothetical protein
MVLDLEFNDASFQATSSSSINYLKDDGMKNTQNLINNIQVNAAESMVRDANALCDFV